MSAAAAAKQRLDDLHRQLETYRDRLRQQEDDLRRFQTDMSQTRTVIDVTLPAEIGKAKREYTGTLSYYKSQETIQLTRRLGASWVRDNLGPRFDSTAIATAAYALLVQILGEGWFHIMVCMAGIFVAAIFVPSRASFST